MSVTGIASSVLTAFGAFQGGQSGHTNSKKVQNDLTQLGQDLQSGNLSQSQSDFATLSQDLSGQTGTSTTSTTSSSLTQAFGQLGTDLKSGNLSAAQKDYTTIQLDLLHNTAQAGIHAHHHHHGGGSQDASSAQQTNPIAQAFSQLASDLQSGNLSGSQQAYASIQSDLQDLGGFSDGAASTSGSSGGSINLLV